jgi:geranylgeranyl pyrophosphate synthase
MRLAQLYPALAGLLAQVEEGMEGTWRGQPGFLGLAARRALSGRGKRLRPGIALLAAESAGGATATSVAAAAAVEVLHTASLVHDDVVDGAASRRGRRSANAMWGNKVSVLLGDYLIARALELIPAEEHGWLAPLIARVAAQMCTAQVKEVRAAGAPLAEREYLDIVKGKTASLFGLCGRVGARSAGGSAELVASLAAFAESFGVAFQFADDILDLVGTDGKSGKPEGRDLAERKFTLPLIVGAEMGGRPVRARLARILAKPAISERDIADARELVESAGAIEPAWGRVRAWLESAQRELEPVPESEAKRALAAACGELFPMPVMAAAR